VQWLCPIIKRSVIFSNVQGPSLFGVGPSLVLFDDDCRAPGIIQKDLRTAVNADTDLRTLDAVD